MPIFGFSLTFFALFLLFDRFDVEKWHFTNELHWLGIDQALIQFVPSGALNKESFNEDSFFRIRLGALRDGNKFCPQFVNGFVGVSG